MNLTDAMAMGWKEALILVGFICILAGLLIRPRGVTLKGFSVAMMTVGAMLIIAWPLGRFFGLW